MHFIELRQVTKRYGAATIVDHVDLVAEQGVFLTLLGPSGCGKSTILNIIAGFLKAETGEVLIEGRSMSGVPPEQRNIGFVFQNYALFPHMTVGENVAFGLRMRGIGKGDQKRIIDEALEVVQLHGLHERYPRQLSGGQQQRVAIARAIAVKPRVLLLDEPLSNLDAKLRRQMRFDLRRIQREVGITTIFVTHDQEEALALSDQVVVLAHGRLQQVGTPRELYQRPASRFVAEFLGETNVLEGTVCGFDGAYAVLDVAGQMLRGIARGELREGNRAGMIVRPDHVSLSPAAETAENRLSVKVEQRTFQGSRTIWTLRCGEIVLQASADSRADAASDADDVHAHWSPDDSMVFGADV